MNNNPDYIIIGASVLDALALPVAPNVFETGSVAADHIAMHTGGDALNEATVLASLGESVRLVSKIGADYAGNYIDAHCQHLKMDTTFLRREPSLETSVNLVLVDNLGGTPFRHFAQRLSPQALSFGHTEYRVFRGKIPMLCQHFRIPRFRRRCLGKIIIRGEKGRPDSLRGHDKAKTRRDFGGFKVQPAPAGLYFSEPGGGKPPYRPHGLRRHRGRIPSVRSPMRRFKNGSRGMLHKNGMGTVLRSGLSPCPLPGHDRGRGHVHRLLSGRAKPWDDIAGMWKICKRRGFHLHRTNWRDLRD